MTVVTNDRELESSVRALGASVISVEEFIRVLAPRGKRTQKKSEKQPVSSVNEHKINEEFKKIWGIE